MRNGGAYQELKMCSRFYQSKEKWKIEMGRMSVSAKEVGVGLGLEEVGFCLGHGGW